MNSLGEWTRETEIETSYPLVVRHHNAFATLAVTVLIQAKLSALGLCKLINSKLLLALVLTVMDGMRTHAGTVRAVTGAEPVRMSREVRVFVVFYDLHYSI